MMLTLTYSKSEVSEGSHVITFEGSPEKVQSTLNGFIANGIWVKQILILGSN